MQSSPGLSSTRLPSYQKAERKPWVRGCSSYSRFHMEVSFLKNILSKNGYPSNVVDSCIKLFLNKLHRPKLEVCTVPKKVVIFILPFLGHTSLKIRSQLHSLFHEKLPHCNIRIIFRASVRLQSLFHFKDRVPKLLQSGLVYCFKCSGCNATYYGKTKRHFKVRICEHLGISHLTGKRKTLQPNQHTAVLEHCLFCHNSPSFDDFVIISRESNDFKLTLKESILINRDKPLLNRTVQSMPLELF